MVALAHSIYLLLLFSFARTTTNETSREIVDEDELYVDLQDLSDLIIAKDDQQVNVCRDLLRNFASQSAHFTKCVILNAKPISLCRNCEKYLINATFAYNVIAETCNDILVNVDRLEVVKSMSDNNFNIWAAASCENCYNDTSEDLSEDVAEFFKLINETNECFIEYNATMCVLGNDKLCGPSEACNKCNATYKTLKTLYMTFVDKFDFSNVCMDVVDAMNMTRQTWNEFQCIRHENNLFVLFTIAGFLCLTPIVFYLSHWISSEENKSRIVPQKRLVATRSHAQLSSSINF